MMKKIVQNDTITLARALLALCMLVTLLFTSVDQLFPPYHLAKISENVKGVMHLNFFFWFDNPLIPYLFSIVVLLVCILGYFPRYLCVLQSWVAYSIFYSMLIVEGGDQINVILTFLLIPVCLLDSRVNGWVKVREEQPENNNTSIFDLNAKCALVFIKIQMAILYLNAGVAKIFAPEWSNGTAVYYWFHDNMFGAPEWVKSMAGFLFKNDIPVSMINWGVIFLEIGLFVALFLKQEYKYRLFILAIAFHFMIIVVHGLPSFFLAMSAGLVLYLTQLDLSIAENYQNFRLSIKNLVKHEREI